MDAQQPHTPFRPLPRDFAGHPMPASVPEGLRLELSRARIVEGREEEFDEWMSMLNNRYDECLETLPAERAVFEATFRHEEADGSTWIYHLSLMGKDGAGLDESNPVDAAHGAYTRRVKERGWEELTPKFMLTPSHLREAMVEWALTGQEPVRELRQDPGPDSPMPPATPAPAPIGEPRSWLD